MLRVQQELAKLQLDIVKMKEKADNKKMGNETKFKVCTHKSNDEIK